MRSKTSFIFRDYRFDATSKTASFYYALSNGFQFEEHAYFEHAAYYDPTLLDKALFLSFMIVGTSYYKTFPCREMILEKGSLDQWQAEFFSTVYQEGLSQFAFENHLTRDNLALFKQTTRTPKDAVSYSGKGSIALQSGGKDSLLLSTLLATGKHPFTTMHVSNSPHYPAVLDSIGDPLVIATRTIDHAALSQANKQGARNGHVPITYIVESFALIQALLMGASTILVSIGHEGEEPHGQIGDLPVTHQWSKTWSAEKALAEYVSRYISPDITIGSPLRGYTELRVTELFVRHAWSVYGHQFSSCNVVNYGQDTDNSTLKWCGECAKCANSYLLFAPFLPADELKTLFAGQDLFAKSNLQHHFKGLLGIDAVMKPFECVGEIAELRLAYHLAMKQGGYQSLTFAVPASSFDYKKTYPAQPWVSDLIGQPE